MENTTATTPKIHPLDADRGVAVQISTTPREESANESFPMNGGDGTYSYTKNSQLQKYGSDYAKEMIKNAIIEGLDTETLAINASNSFRIVDFGCSVGPNTFFIVQNLMESVKMKSSLQNLDSSKIEFQVFFNDHSANDFNTLFASLLPDKQYYAAGVPGSFYSRLFPRSSISLAHSSHAIQWLPRVPEDMLDVKSRAWNEGRIHYTNAGDDVVNAYAAQFEKDMGVFISARAEEIMEGGMMVILMPGKPDGVARSHPQLPAGVLFDCLGSFLMDMANEGMVDKAEIDSFNIPIYFPAIEDVKALIESNGCFSIEKIEQTNPSHGKDPPNAEILIMHFIAALEGIFTQHFGKEVTQKIFKRVSERSEELAQWLGSGYPYSTQIFIVLKRKY